jgi:urea transport system substrate-binding protein
MSPEQAGGHPIDQRSDLFALGCVMYAMLAGRSPFERANYLQTLKALADDNMPPLAEIFPGLPAPVGELIERLLRKDPAARPADARRVADEIRELEQSLTCAGLVPLVPAAAAPTTPGRPRQKLGWGAWACALTIGAAALLGGWSQYHRLAGLLGAESPDGEGTPVVAADETDGAGAAATTDPDLPTIKVGILHSMSGPMATSERSIVDAFLMAVNEINESGGLLNGRRVEALVRDGKSNEQVFADQAEELITREQVVMLFGCWRSPCRKLVEEVCRRHDHLLAYPITYEGIEESPYVIYMGGAPNQQILPAVKWAFAFLGKRKFFLIGVDGIYSHTTHAIIRDELKSLGGEVVGEGYRPLGDTDFAGIAAEAARSGADVILNTVSGTGNVSLFHCLRQAGLTSDRVPTVSFKVTEEELSSLAAYDEDLVGDYAAWSYFQSLSNQDNTDFLTRLHERFGPARVASDPMAAAYASVYLWARGVESCQTDQVTAVRAAILMQSFEAPEGELAVDPGNRHALRRALIGRVNANLQYDIVWTSPKPIPPEPFPRSRTRDEWLNFQRGLYEQWGGHWRPDRPRKPL